MDFHSTATIMRKELWDAQHNRWLFLFSLAFVTFATVMAWTSLSGPSIYSDLGIVRLGASLISTVTLIVPLMGLTLGALSLAGERDRGSLSYLLAQPITRLDVLVGKYLGLLFALWTVLTIGFGFTGLLVSLNTGSASTVNYLCFVALTFCLTAIGLSLGFLLSTFARKSSAAMGSAMLVWLTLTFLTDLGILGSAMVLELNVHQLLILTLSNPLQLFKTASIQVLHGNLEVLGPGGIYATQILGSKLLPVLVALMLIFAVIPLWVSCYFMKRDNSVF